MRKLGATLLALPVLLRIYMPVLAPRGVAGRAASGIIAAAMIALIAFAGLPPAPSAAVPQSGPPQPVAAELLGAVTTAHPLTAPFTIAFDAPMDPASVAAALRITPDAAVSFAWEPDGRTLVITPVGHWQPDTLYQIKVSGSARAADGGVLAKPLNALIMTTRSGRAELAATRVAGGRARLDTAIRITLDHAADAAAVEAALQVEPPVAGEVTADGEAGTFVFTPTEPLAPGTVYSVTLDALVDAEGVAFAEAPSLTIRTSSAPDVVRFRPRDGQGDIERTAVLSVRFSERMNHDATAAAFKVTANGTRVKGTVGWAELGKVLVFRPADPLPYASKVVMTVGGGATSRSGVGLDQTSSGTFSVAPKPKPKPVAPKPKPKAVSPKPKPISHSGGGGAVSGSWTGVETYYLKLMNCTRTGGWVTSGGDCSSPGGRDVAALALSSSISARVSRPYAKLLATRGQCSHFIGGNPGDRLRRAGFTSYRWAENLGCRSGNPYSAVLGSHRFFQSEKPYNGGHYRNLMNAQYNQAGIGVWVSGGQVRLVVDLYHP